MEKNVINELIAALGMNAAAERIKEAKQNKMVDVQFSCNV